MSQEITSCAFKSHINCQLSRVVDPLEGSQKEGRTSVDNTDLMSELTTFMSAAMSVVVLHNGTNNIS